MAYALIQGEMALMMMNLREGDTLRKRPQPPKSERSSPKGRGRKSVPYVFTHMVMQLSFNRCGVVPCIQDGPARGASRTPLAPTTGAYSEARSELNSPTGTRLTIMQWNSEGVQKKKIELKLK